MSDIANDTPHQGASIHIATALALCTACDDSGSGTAEPSDGTLEPEPLPPVIEPDTEPDRECQTVVEDYEAARQRALRRVNDVLCNNEIRCRRTRQCRTDSCDIGSPLNTPAVERIDEQHPPDVRCGGDCEPDPNPCPEPEGPGPDCVEGSCLMTAPFDDNPTSETPPQNCEEKIASTTNFLDTLSVPFEPCEESADCIAVSFKNACTTSCERCSDGCFARAMHRDNLQVYEARLEAHRRWSDCANCGPAEQDCYTGAPAVCDNRRCVFPQ